MINNDLKMWILGTAVKTASTGTSFMPVVVLAQYPISETKPEIAVVAEVEQEENESPEQHEEIIESEDVPQAENLHIKWENFEEEEDEEPEEESEEIDEPEETLGEVDDVLLGAHVVREREEFSRVDEFTGRYRTTQKNMRMRVKWTRYALVLILLLLASVAVGFAWRYFFAGTAQVNVTENVVSAISAAPDPELPAPFEPQLPIIAPAFGPLISLIPETPLPAPAVKPKPTAKPPVPATKPKPKPAPKLPKIIEPVIVKKPATPAPPVKSSELVVVDSSVSVPRSPLFDDIQNKEYRKAITQSRKNLAQNSRDRTSLFALGVALYAVSDFSGARTAFYNCLLIDSPRLPNVTVGNFSVIQNANNKRIQTPQPTRGDIEPLLRATQASPANRALYINLALSNLKSGSPINPAELYNTILSHAEKTDVRK